MHKYTKIIIFWSVLLMSAVTYLLSWWKSGEDIALFKTFVVGGIFILIGWGCACIIPLLSPDIQRLDEISCDSDEVDFEFPDEKENEEK